MKRFVSLLPVACLAFVGCEDGSYYGSGGYDPLDPAGGGSAGMAVANTGYRPGEFVSSVSSSTAFFKAKPSGDATADKLLSSGTQMKVLSDDGSFVKVELDSGEVGFVPAVMVIGKDEQTSSYSDGAYQVYPPVDGVIPLETDPTIDPTVPVVPTTIDPDAPSELPPPTLPDDAPTPGLGAEPALPDPTLEVSPAPEDAVGRDPSAE
ncbi:MAG: hypothetical protein ACQKBU_12195 [Verrucomicrobiales bacterium]